jgi:hypothetical protein
MGNELKELMDDLQNNIGNSDFAAYCSSLAESLESLPSPKEAIAPLLVFMSNNPGLDYGMPGAFVHFIEKFPENEYADDLIASIRNHPTDLNTWMLLRIMNTWSSPRQNEYIETMKSAQRHPAISAGLKEQLSEDLADFAE